MRLELEKKHCDEETTEQDPTEHHLRRNPQRISHESMMGGQMSESCMNNSGFTMLHYNNPDGRGIDGTNCQMDGTGVREDSLDLYAIRDDCYPSGDPVNSGSPTTSRKMHQDFGQSFQAFQGKNWSKVILVTFYSFI